MEEQGLDVCLAIHGAPESQAKLIAELASARLEFGQIERSRVGQYGNQQFKYAPLGTLTEATAKPLARHGIAVLQFITNSPADPAKHRLTTWVAGHGAYISSSLDFAPKDAKDENSNRSFEWIKEYGKLCTYLCRYAYKTTFALDSEPDSDDAEPERRPEPRRDAPRPEPKPQAKREPKPAAPAATTIPAPVAPPEARVGLTPGQTDTVTNNVTQEEPKTDPDDGPVDQDMLDQLYSLREQLGWSKMKLLKICADEWQIEPSSIVQSMKTARRVMERMQHAILDRQQKAQQQGAA